jgi:hypothetical protein
VKKLLIVLLLTSPLHAAINLDDGGGAGQCGNHVSTPWYQNWGTFNPPLYDSWSEMEISGHDVSSDCGTVRVTDKVDLWCFGSGDQCWAQNNWNSGWRPVGYSDATVVKTHL